MVAKRCFVVYRRTRMNGQRPERSFGMNTKPRYDYRYETRQSTKSAKRGEIRVVLGRHKFDFVRSLRVAFVDMHLAVKVRGCV